MTRLWKRHGLASKYGDFRVSRLGRREGRLDPPIPAWDAEALPPALREIVRAGDGALQLVAQAWLDKDRKLKPAWFFAENARDFGFGSRGRVGGRHGCCGGGV